MSLVLLFAGLLFIVAAVRGKQDDLFRLLKDDFTGSNNFIFWAAAIVLIGAIGYLPKLKGFSAALLALVLVGIALKKGTGFFDQLTAAVQSTAKGSASDSW